MNKDKALLDAAKHTQDNEIEILKSEKAGCIFCRHEFSARDISEWISDEKGTRALCPECGMDAVIGDASLVDISKPHLKEIGKLIYDDEKMKNDLVAEHTYVQRYESGKIAHTDHTLSLYKKYIKRLADDGDYDALLSLGALYRDAHQYRKAIDVYSDPILAADSVALVELGRIYKDCIKGNNYGIDALHGSTAFSKAAALGSLTGLYFVAECYREGYGVIEDHPFAWECYKRGFYESYNAALFLQEDTHIFPYFTASLADTFYYGTDIVEKDIPTALHYYLIAEFACAYDETLKGNVSEPSETFKFISNRIDEISKTMDGYERREPIFDDDTFLSSRLETSDKYNEKTIKKVDFDELSGDLFVDMEYEKPTLIVDEADLYCGIHMGTISWRFTNVDKHSLRIGQKFFLAEEDGDGNINLLDRERASFPVATITYKRREQ